MHWLLIAAGIVATLGVNSAVLVFEARRSNQLRIKAVDRMEAFYAGELGAWNAQLRAEQDLSPGAQGQVIWLDNTPFAQSATWLAEEPYSSVPGTPLSIRTTLPLAPASMLVRRLDASRFIASTDSAGSRCGRIGFTSQRSYRVCLAHSDRKAPQKKQLTASYGQYAVNIDGRIYVWQMSGEHGDDPHVWRTWVVLVNDPRPVTANTSFEALSPGIDLSVQMGTLSFSLFAIGEDGKLWRVNSQNQLELSTQQPLNAQGKAVGVQALSQDTVLADDGLLYAGEPHDTSYTNVQFASNVVFTRLGDSDSGVSPCALAKDGRVFCWQSEQNSVLRFVSVDLSGLRPGDTVRQLSSSSSTHCLLTDGGDVYCWASQFSANSDGSDGLFRNEIKPSRRLDLRHVTGSKKIIKVCAPNVGLILTEDGIGYSWGRSDIGNLQYCRPVSDWDTYCQTPVPHPVPIQTAHLPVGLKWKDLVGTPDNACGLTQDNNIYCWGSVTGNHATNYKAEPALVKKIW